MIAITGAAGFIGSNLAHRLSRQGRELLLIDDPPTAEKAVNWAGLGRYRFIPLDQFLDDLPSLEGTVEAVFHLGACSSTTETDWSYLLRNNVDYTRRLWQWCAEVRPAVLLCVERRHVRRRLARVQRPDAADGTPAVEPVRQEQERLRHLGVDEVAKGAPAPAGWAGLKFFNVYGPRERHKGKMASVVWHARRQILETGEVRLFRSNDPAYPDGGQLRDFVFVEDCIDNMLWLWEHPETSGVFNSGTGVARTFKDLASGRLRRARTRAPNSVHRHARIAQPAIPELHPG